LKENAKLFRQLMNEAGFTLQSGEHPIVPVMFSSESEALQVATGLQGRGIHAVAFSYPVVPLGKARIRIQLSAEHSEEDIRRCVSSFIESAKK
jgi:glycine C-acetyltransferase